MRRALPFCHCGQYSTFFVTNQPGVGGRHLPLFTLIFQTLLFLSHTKYYFSEIFDIAILYLFAWKTYPIKVEQRHRPIYTIAKPMFQQSSTDGKFIGQEIIIYQKWLAFMLGGTPNRYNKSKESNKKILASYLISTDVEKGIIMTSIEVIEWKQERPEWCSQEKCQFLRRVMDDACIGKLDTPEDHEGIDNTHGWCMAGVVEDHILHLETNITDIEYMRWLFDAVDDGHSSWLSNRC